MNMENSNYEIGKPAFSKSLRLMIIDIFIMAVYRYFKLKASGIKIKRAMLDLMKEIARLSNIKNG